MVEFGEQLRRAREEKGMTQQSLAEQLYVTRQAVSRWECGDRYPDLLTTKKISQILEVSLDDLLSGKEMEKVVERNPVIEKKSVNNIMIALYAFVIISFFITIVDIIIRFPLQSEMIDYNDIQAIVINVLALLIQIFFFAYVFYRFVCASASVHISVLFRLLKTAGVFQPAAVKLNYTGITLLALSACSASMPSCLSLRFSKNFSAT